MLIAPKRNELNQIFDLLDTSAHETLHDFLNQERDDWAPATTESAGDGDQMVPSGRVVHPDRWYRLLEEQTAVGEVAL